MLFVGVLVCWCVVCCLSLSVCVCSPCGLGTFGSVVLCCGWELRLGPCLLGMQTHSLRVLSAVTHTWP